MFEPPLAVIFPDQQLIRQTAVCEDRFERVTLPLYSATSVATETLPRSLTPTPRNQQRREPAVELTSQVVAYDRQPDGTLTRGGHLLDL
jgi:hypothetical protein